MLKKIFLVIFIAVALVILYLIIRPLSGGRITSEEQEAALKELPASQQDYFKTLIEGIQSGGPPKDGIPAIDKPKYESVAEADTWLQLNDVVFGVDYQGEIIAIPQRILVWHEIMNDTLGGEAVSFTYCPLTGTAIGFKSPAPKANDPSLGVSGKLVNSNLIMYDRATDSYWPQILGQAIIGQKTGSQLEEFPLVWTTWDRWKTKHPNTKVLSRNTSFARNYNPSGDPYGSYLKENKGYYSNDRLIFSPINSNSILGNKEVIIGIRDKDRNAVAIVKDVLKEKKQLDLVLAERPITIVYDAELDFYQAKYTDTNEWINAFDAMWFAWYTYYPETQLIQ